MNILSLYNLFELSHTKYVKKREGAGQPKKVDYLKYITNSVCIYVVGGFAVVLNIGQFWPRFSIIYISFTSLVPHSDFINYTIIDSLIYFHSVNSHSRHIHSFVHYCKKNLIDSFDFHTFYPFFAIISTIFLLR